MVGRIGHTRKLKREASGGGSGGGDGPDDDRVPSSQIFHDDADLMAGVCAGQEVGDTQLEITADDEDNESQAAW